MKVKTQEIKKGILKSLNVEKEKVEDSFSEDDNESLDSDQELQLAFARKELKPGLNIVTEKPKEFPNDKEGLKRKLKDLYLKMSWDERLDVTVPGMHKESEQIDKELADNDFKRESLFLRQAEEAVKVALPRLEKLGVAVKRPEDYFAEMAKSDEHMKKVRETLLSKHSEMERREKVRKLRELKKMGKQIQIEAEKKKQSNKKVYKSESQFKNEIEEGEPKSKKTKSDKEESKIKKKGKKSEYKDKKFGFGGRKKRSKYNTADSYAEAYKNPADRKKKKGEAAPAKGGFRKNAQKKFANKNKPKRKSK